MYSSNRDERSRLRSGQCTEAEAIEMGGETRTEFAGRRDEEENPWVYLTGNSAIKRERTLSLYATAPNVLYRAYAFPKCLAQASLCKGSSPEGYKTKGAAWQRQIACTGAAYRVAEPP
uniref:Uncharacterized protein n=1 Tax=Vespula pensylvanica TaxID=30213 RepID=A0A834KKY5_VESPE|nr:hypothetical protein H0235_014365 [Vespula pensylvanica]